ncbi:hypothetical protein [Rhodococcus sp. NPDC057529]|uniref:hypothetical protein n=1 Tax=Rhodococcus sp. NPDC057529 TaxID=3346158 RepID=UPI0036704370
MGRTFAAGWAFADTHLGDEGPEGDLVGVGVVCTEGGADRSGCELNPIAHVLIVE